MRKIKHWIPVILMVLLVVSGVFSVQGQEITITGEKCPLSVYSLTEPGGEPQTVEFDSITLLGVISGDYVVVMWPEVTDTITDVAEAPEGESAGAAGDSAGAAGDSAPESEAAADDAEAEPEIVNQLTGYVDRAELEEKLPTVDLTALPAVDGWTNIRNGNNSPQVRTVQEKLLELGFLEGVVDGSFGQRSQAALNAYLASKGLPQIGYVDIVAWFLLQNEGSQNTLTIKYPFTYTVEEKFASILDSFSDASVLEDFTDKSWKFSYDAFDGCGTLRKTLDEEAYVQNARAVERLTMKMDLGLYLQQSEEDGVINAVPALFISTTGAFRPYIKSATLNADGVTSELSVLSTDYSIDVLDIVEDTCLVFTGEALDLIEGMSDGAIRLRGTNKNYDIDLAAVSEELREFAQNTEALR